MKLLVLASRFPYPLEKGDKLRLYYQLQEFAKQHEVVLVALHEQPVSDDALTAISEICQRVYTLPISKVASVLQAGWGWLRGKPLQVSYFWRNRLKARIDQIIRQEAPDQIFCQLIRMVDYVRSQDIPVHLDYMDCFSLGARRRASVAPVWQRGIWRREARLLQTFEQAVFGDMAGRYIISVQDKEALGLSPAAKVAISPNGLDLARFQPIPEVEIKAEICFVGNMGYFPNIQAAIFLVEQIMPKVWERLPEARVILAGARPAPAVQKLGQDPRITVTGWVNDIREPYQQGKLFVAPLFTGSGQQNKILEAMALARPCLTTPLVNKAIGADSKMIALADSADSFADQIGALLEDDARLTSMGLASQQFVQQQINWAEAVNPILEGFARLDRTQRTTNVS